MPWSNQTGGGGWKGGNNGGPWGQGPRGNGPNPPDLEELLRRSQDKFRNVFKGGRPGGLNPIAFVAVLAVVFAFLVYNFFTFRVEPDEVGVVLRFGKYQRKVEPGLNFRLPYPIESVFTPQVTRAQSTTVGTSIDSGRDVPQESLMLTGDENIVDIDFAVFWVIKEASDYLFNVQNQDGTVKAIAESAMREVIGRSNIQNVLTAERLDIQTEVLKLMQQKLDQYGAGIQVTEVKLLNVGPPAEVIDAFRDVQAAAQDQDRLKNIAETTANQIIPQARGQASQMIEGANADRDKMVAEAKGQAGRFSKVYESYKLSPDVTRERMYLETIATIMGATDKVIVDNSGSGVLPYLPLPSLRGAPAAPAAAAPPPAAAAPPSASTTPGVSP